MIYLIVSDNKDVRNSHISGIVSGSEYSEVFSFDDTFGGILDLEQYLFPSLFSIAPPIIHIRFMLEADSLSPIFIKKLLASPTMFLFEEMNLAAPVITMLKKSGAIVHSESKTKQIKKTSDIFGATLAITAKDKKSRWIAYRNALKDHPIEAIIGILYWKVRDLASKNLKEKENYILLYKNLLSSHAMAWQSGTPLELAVEKVILTN